jgi:hypothetical protein
MPPKEKKEIARLKAELTVARRTATKHHNARLEAENKSDKHQKSLKRLGDKAQAKPGHREDESGGLGGLDKALKESGSPAPVRGRSSGPPGKPASAASGKEASSKRSPSPAKSPAKVKGRPPGRKKKDDEVPPSDEEKPYDVFEGAVVPGFRRAEEGSADVGGEWIHFHGNSRRVRTLKVSAKDVLEAALPNEDGTAWGSRAIFRVRSSDDPHGSGQFLAVECGGASAPEVATELETAFPVVSSRCRQRAAGSVTENLDGGAKPLHLLHLCANGTENCRATYGRLGVQHVEMVRKVQPGGLTADWIAEDFKELGPSRESKRSTGDSSKSIVPSWAIRKPGDDADHEPKEKGRRRRSRSRGRRRRRRGSSSRSSNSEASELFRVAPGGENRIRRVAADFPGVLYRKGMERIAERLGTRQGCGRGQPLVANYVLIILNAVVPLQEQSKRNREDMALTAQMLDTLGQADEEADSESQAFDPAKAKTADQLMQRFKAIEQAILDKGSWYTAENMSLLPDTTPGIATHGEREASLKMRLAEHKYEEAREKLTARTKRPKEKGKR